VFNGAHNRPIWVAEALGRIGSEARAAARVFEKVESDRDRVARISAFQCIGAEGNSTGWDQLQEEVSKPVCHGVQASQL
jgi:hypothetical protein